MVRFQNGDAFGAIVIRPAPPARRQRWVVGVLDQIVELDGIGTR